MFPYYLASTILDQLISIFLYFPLYIGTGGRLRNFFLAIWTGSGRTGIVDISGDIENNQQQDSIIWEMMNSILKEILNNVVKEDMKDLDEANNDGDDEQITVEKNLEIDFPKLPSSEKMSLKLLNMLILSKKKKKKMMIMVL